MITIPTNIVTDLFGSIANMYNGTFVMIELLISIALVMFIARKVVGDSAGAFVEAPVAHQAEVVGRHVNGRSVGARGKPCEDERAYEHTY